MGAETRGRVRAALAPVAILAITGVLGAAQLGGCGSKATAGRQQQGNHVTAASDVEAGRYLIAVGGCNDCHTPGVMQGAQVPEAQWLTGIPVGWRGPWGTTYASNLTRMVPLYDEDDWIRMVRARNGRPPMPWPSLHAMSDKDLRSMYRYITSLGPKGSDVPAFVPPDQTPATPFIALVPQVVPAGGAPAGGGGPGGSAPGGGAPRAPAGAMGRE
ncbi:MAG TPA: cytochrome C [Polyangia bacterium]|jgi:mono/diheme cytochrome c family protein